MEVGDISSWDLLGCDTV